MRVKRGSTTIILGVAMQLGFDRPLEAARVVLGRIATHDQHHVGVLDVDPAVGHRAASEGGPQTGDRRTVSNPGLRFEIADPQAAHGLDDEIIQLVGVSAAAGPADPFATIDRVAVSSFSTKVASRVFFTQRAISSIACPRRCLPSDRSRDVAPAGFSKRRSL